MQTPEPVLLDFSGDDHATTDGFQAEVTLQEGQELSVKVNSIPSTGYQWTVAKLANTLQVAGDEPGFLSNWEAPPGSEDVQGVRGTERFVFQATGAHITDQRVDELVLTLARPFEPDEPPISAVVVRVVLLPLPAHFGGPGF